jgi:epoxyqueuosine reductase
LEPSALTKKVKSKAQELGFTLVGVTRAQPTAHADVFQRWLAAGHHGEMTYLAAERAVQRRADPRLILPECQSILVLGVPYSNPASAPKPADGRSWGRIAAFAWGDDYHQVLRPRLRELMAFIEEQVGHDVPNRWYTDSGPVAERELAARAGLGWIGRNSMLINPERGSYFLLAEILLGIELESDAPLSTDHCGACTRCLEACPTQCILPDRTIDAAHCISYLTIELKGAVPRQLRSQTQDWVFGCDICQEVCPWNERFASAASDPALAPREGGPWVDVQTGLEITTSEFNKRFKNSAVQRPRRRGFLRNLALAAGNAEGEEHVPALIESLRNEIEPLARGHAAWALGQLGGQAARTALEAAGKSEADPWVMEEIRGALEEEPV